MAVLATLSNQNENRHFRICIERPQSACYSGFVKVLSVNTSGPRPIMVGQHEVLTGIFKKPREGRVAVRRLSLEGDVQADLRVHGGEFKAVYAYPIEHYSYWKQTLGLNNLEPGVFGENLTIQGLTEEMTCIGDILQIGTATLQVTQPRTPCAKLASKFERPQIIKEFLGSGRSGFYLRVIEEGELGAGDSIQISRRDPNAVSVRALLGLTDLNEGSLDLARRAMQVDALPPNWRKDVAAFLK